LHETGLPEFMLDDAVGAIRHVLATDAAQGPVNVVSPNACTCRSFVDTLGAVLHRPTFVPVPAFAARLAFGEMAEETILASTRVIPKRLLEQGLTFRWPELLPALEAELA